MTIDIKTITDRTTWIAFRAEWRADYRNASDDIRAVKRDMRRLVAERRSGARSDEDVDTRMSSNQFDREMGRREANRLMKRLEEAKRHRDALLASRDSTASEAA